MNKEEVVKMWIEYRIDEAIDNGKKEYYLYNRITHTEPKRIDTFLYFFKTVVPERTVYGNWRRLNEHGLFTTNGQVYKYIEDTKNDGSKREDFLGEGSYKMLTDYLMEKKDE